MTPVLPEDTIIAGSVFVTGAGGDEIEAYLARPTAASSRGSVVVIHHLPGYDQETKEITRRLATMGYAALCPNLYWRDAPGAAVDEAARVVRDAGGVPDDRLVGDVRGAVEHLDRLEGSNGKVAVIGHCSGGRQSVLAAASLSLDAAVDCYGAVVVGEPPPGFPLKGGPLYGLLSQISCPVLGLYGNQDSLPSPELVDELDALLDEYDVEHEFHRYDGAGHAFFAVDRASYDPAAAVDGWRRIEDFLARHLTS